MTWLIYPTESEFTNDWTARQRTSRRTPTGSWQT